jgi:hypothetical protein
VNIHQSAIIGEGPINIARDLNGRNIPGPRGKGWHKAVIHSILTNEIYTGVFVGGEK